MARVVRINGVGIVVPRVQASTLWCVDVIMLDPTEKSFSALKLPAHSPFYCPPSGKPTTPIAKRIIVMRSSVSGPPQIEGYPNVPTGNPTMKNFRDAFWLPHLPTLTGIPRIASSLLPQVGVPLDSRIHTLVRIEGGRLSNGGFAASSSNEMSLFRSGASGVLPQAEALFLEVQENSSNEVDHEILNTDWSPSSDKKLPFLGTSMTSFDLLSNGAKSGAFTTDFQLYALCLETPVPYPKDILKEDSSRKWPSFIPSHLKGGHTGGRPVCPPVIGGE